MIYVFSNRNLIRKETWLGEAFNTVTNDNIRVAKYVRKPKQKLQFYKEVEGEPLPSLQVIAEVEKSDKPCCIFIHGFDQSLASNLKKGEEIESYGVNVIIFSWPSNPGPQAWYWKLKEYKSARQNAMRSSVALERFFDKFNDRVQENGGVTKIKTLVCHSLGNFLLQTFASGLGFEGQTTFLNNILLHQADVNSFGHEQWADLVAQNSRVLATINETDNILDYSDIINPARLGNTLGNLRSEKLGYFNFGRMPAAKNKHRLWIPPVTENSSARLFFQEVFLGVKVRTGHLEYDERRNCHHIE